MTNKCGKRSFKNTILNLDSSQLCLLKLFRCSAVAQAYALQKSKFMLSINYYCSEEFMCSSSLTLCPDNYLLQLVWAMKETILPSNFHPAFTQSDHMAISDFDLKINSELNSLAKSELYGH